VGFCQWLGTKDGAKYRLPTEAEWEYACRAGTTTPFHFGDTLDSNLANFNGKFPWETKTVGPDREKPTEVGSYQPNAFGLCDMHGNQWEWCQDFYSAEYYKSNVVDNPPGPARGKMHVIRGGDWQESHALACRSALRYEYGAPFASVGFRVVREIDESRAAAGGRDYALDFNGQNAVLEIPEIGLGGSTFTVEAWTWLRDNSPQSTAYLLYGTGPFFLSVQPGRDEAKWTFKCGVTGNPVVASPKSSAGKWVHVAAVFDGREARLYLNGAQQGTPGAAERSFGKLSPLRIGANSRGDGNFFNGLIDELRFSKSVRYTDNFDPQRRFTADSNTLALYHCDDGPGEVLTDSSGHDHHGSVIGAKAVNADGTAIK
jgi:hypothetical protein